MGVYAQVADVVNYIEGYTAADHDATEREIARAERDIDNLMFRPQALVNGKRIDPALLTPDESMALTNATCAQVEYRLAMGPDFFVRAQYDSINGPDFTTSGKLPYIGPKVWRELNGLFRWRQQGARATSGRRRGGSAGFFTPGSLPWPIGGMGGGWY